MREGVAEYVLGTEPSDFEAILRTQFADRPLLEMGRDVQPHHADHVKLVCRPHAPVQELTSAQLVLRAKAGDRTAFEALYLRYVDRLYAWLRISLRDSHAAEDATQHVFIQAFEALPRFEVRDRPVHAWLFRIARNHVINVARNRTRVDVVPPEKLAERCESAPWTLIGAMGSDRTKRFGEDLETYVEGLKLAQRQVLALRYMLDLTTDEIAQVMDMTSDNVRQIQHRALATLRRRVPGQTAAPKVLRRERMLAVLRHAGVLRARRFALAYSPAAYSSRGRRTW